MTNSPALPAGFEIESVGKSPEVSALPEGFEVESIPEEESLLRKTGRAVKGVLDIPERVTKEVILPFTENIATQVVGGAGAVISPAVAVRNYLTTLAATGDLEKSYESASRGARETGEFFGGVAERIPTTELGKKSSEYVAKGFNAALEPVGGIAREAIRVPLQSLEAAGLPRIVAKPIEDVTRVGSEFAAFGGLMKGGGKAKSIVRDIYNEKKGMPPTTPTAAQFEAAKSAPEAQADIKPLEVAKQEFAKPEVKAEYEEFLADVEGKGRAGEEVMLDDLAKREDARAERKAWEDYERFPELPEGFEVESMPDVSVADRSSYVPRQDARSATGDVSKIDMSAGADIEARTNAALLAAKSQPSVEQSQSILGKVKDKLKSEAGAVVTAEKKPFYSKLEEFVNKDMKLSLPIDSARKMAYNKGVTVDEWNDAFRHLRGKVTKGQLLDELAVHGRKFEDVVLGEPKVNVSEKTRLHNIYMDALDRAEANGETVNINLLLERPYDSLTENQRTAVYAWKEMEKRPELETAYDSQSAPPQFEKYSEPGYKPGSSRELFVTEPGKLKYSFDLHNRIASELNKIDISPENKLYKQQKQDILNKYGMTLKQWHEFKKFGWQDGHSAYSNISNPIVRIRFNERDVNGKKVLFVEEIQGPNEANQAKMPESLRSRIYDIGVKRIISYAKENGFDEIAWTTGKMQVDRYNLAKYLNEVVVTKTDNNAYAVSYTTKDGHRHPPINLTTPELLQQHIGKALANKAIRDLETQFSTKELVYIETLKNKRNALYDENDVLRNQQYSSGTAARLRQIRGEIHDVDFELAKYLNQVKYKNLDLKIGGEGLKRLYDEKIPGLMEKYGGGKTRKLNIGDGNTYIDTRKDGKGQWTNNITVSSLPLTEKSPSSFTMYSDPLGFQAGAKALGKVVESAKEGWDKVLERNPTIAKLDEKARTRVEEIYRGIKEGTLDPERVMREDPYAIEVFKNLANAEESKNAFMQKVMPEFLDVTKGIKKGSDSSARIGKVLDGQEGVETLTVKEKKAFDFFKENYDWMINEYARNAAGSEEAYRRILSLVNNKEAKRSRVKDLNPTDRAEYDRLRQIVKEIKGEKKINELDVTTRESYEKASQEARDFLHNDFKKNMSEGERAAYDILSRKLTDYLPHLFGKTELKEMFEADIARIQKKLSKTTNANLITKYKNEIEAIEKAILNIEGGKLVNFRDLPRDVFFRFFAERKGAKGYSFDAVKAFESYVYGIARKIYDEPALRKSYEVYEKVSPELKPYTKELVNHYMGYEPRSRFNNFARFVTTFEWIRTLGLNPRSALVNLTQRLNTAVWVGEKYAAQAQAMMLGSKEMRAKADEIFEKSGVGREIPQVLMEGPVAPSLQGLRSITGVFFDAVERGNRQHALLSGYLKAKAKGMSEEAAIKEGIKIVHKTQFRYGKLGMAKWSRNPGGKLALQFLSYPVKQAQFLYDLYKKDRLAFLRFAAYAIGGNMTLQELLDTDMSNAIGFGITFGEALKAIQFAAEGDTRGAIRHAGQAFTPGGGLLPSGPGPAVASAIAIGKASTQGKGLEQLVKEVTPIMWSRAKQAYKAIKEREGSEYPIFDAKDHMSYRLNARQLAQRTLGPRSEKEHKESLKVREERNLEQERIEITKDIAKKFAEGVLNNDESAIDEAVDLIVKYGIDIGDKQLENEIAARLMTKEERTEPGKKETYQILREGEMIRDKYNDEED